MATRGAGHRSRKAKLVLGAGCIIIGAGVAVSGVYAGWGIRTV